MGQAFGDAREEELALLLEVARKGTLNSANLGEQPHSPGPRRAMLAQLVWDGLLEPSFPWVHRNDQQVDGPDGYTRIEREVRAARMTAVSTIIGGTYGVDLRLTHPGRVRISELRDALRRGRIRDATGILFDGRHADRALRVAIAEVAPDRPLAVAFLDVDGLKQANDTVGHAAGDVLVRSYLSAVSAAVEDRGEGFRIGGDEVLVLLPAHDLAASERLVRRAHHLFVSEHLTFEGKPLPARSFCAGLVAVHDPTEDFAKARGRADAEMYRAKKESKRRSPRASLLAVEGRDALVPLTTGESAA